MAGLSPNLDELLGRAWAVRTRHWPPVITASVPVDTLPISVTGALRPRLRPLRRPLPTRRPWKGCAQGRPRSSSPAATPAEGSRCASIETSCCLTSRAGGPTGTRGWWKGEDLEALDGLLDVVSFDSGG